MFIHSLVSGVKAPSCFSQKIAALMMAALLFTLSACGIGTQNPNNAASSQTIVSEEQSSAVLAELAQQLKDGKAAHPKEVTGPSSAKNTPEVQAMVDTPTPQLPVTFKDYTSRPPKPRAITSCARVPYVSRARMRSADLTVTSLPV